VYICQIRNVIYLTDMFVWVITYIRVFHLFSYTVDRVSTRMNSLVSILVYQLVH